MAFNVLIVDDSTSMRAIIKRSIRVSGFDVGEYFEASDGKEALDVLEKEWVDLVMTDINMPCMNGIELIAEMKTDELLSSIPVVMVTTEGSEERVQETMALGASGYIKKPFHPEEVKKTLSKIMGERGHVEREVTEEYEDGDF
jgi:two-component system chemotaxis response regulator CheY